MSLPAKRVMAQNQRTESQGAPKQSKVFPPGWGKLPLPVSANNLGTRVYAPCVKDSEVPGQRQ